MRYSLDQSVRLQWIEEFVNTMEYLFLMSRFSWDFSLRQTDIHDVTSQTFGSRIQTRYLGNDFQIKHLVMALYGTGLNIASREGQQQCKLHAGMFLDGRAMAFLVYDLKNTGLEGSTINNDTLLGGAPTHSAQDILTRRIPEQLPSNSTISPPTRTTSSLSARRSGWAKDVELPNFQIYYEFGGVAVGAFRMFTLFLGAVTTAAPHDEGLPGADIRVYSADRRAFLSLYRDKDAVALTWGEAKRALRVIWRGILILYGARRPDAIFEDLLFLIYNNDKLIGCGMITYYETPIPPPRIDVAR